MALTLTPVVPQTGGRAVCATVELCSEDLLCGAFGIGMTPDTPGTLTLTEVLAGALTLTPVVPV